MGPGKDTHSVLGPAQRESRGWPVKIRQQIHGKHGGGAGCYEQVVNVTERLVAGVERGTTGDVQRSAAQSGLGRRQQTRRRDRR